ncbi:hypothetical protein B0H17DRAFT_1125064 [Mycena rosella]|uniref:Uncharacterized protein n=1 Tax=Mycena rosella TaxID=1033263 RepID=A0AAD7GYT2_MYCRO|nr:hypothetical protein B0H17DRAFT_1125064 [Mycena rosella]
MGSDSIVGDAGVELCRTAGQIFWGGELKATEPKTLRRSIRKRRDRRTAVRAGANKRAAAHRGRKNIPEYPGPEMHSCGSMGPGTARVALYARPLDVGDYAGQKWRTEGQMLWGGELRAAESECPGVSRKGERRQNGGVVVGKSVEAWANRARHFWGGKGFGRPAPGITRAWADPEVVQNESPGKNRRRADEARLQTNLRRALARGSLLANHDWIWILCTKLSSLRRNWGNFCLGGGPSKKAGCSSPEDPENAHLYFDGWSLLSMSQNEAVLCINPTPTDGRHETRRSVRRDRRKATIGSMFSLGYAAHPGRFMGLELQNTPCTGIMRGVNVTEPEDHVARRRRWSCGSQKSGPGEAHVTTRRRSRLYPEKAVASDVLRGLEERRGRRECPAAPHVQGKVTKRQPCGPFLEPDPKCRVHFG